MLSEAFVADHGLSRWRFAAVVGVLSLAAGAAEGVAGWNLFPDNQRMFALLLGAVTAIVMFLAGLAVTAPIWWVLFRLRLRGWAASLAAGGPGAMAVGAAMAWVMFGPGGHAKVTSGAPPSFALLTLGMTPLGLMFGWVIWRLAFVPGPTAPPMGASPSDPQT